MTVAFPLQWPAGWPRARFAKDGRSDFGRLVDGKKRPLTFAEARDGLFNALDKVGSGPAVLSSNFALNSRGEPRGDKARPSDQAVAVYFTRNNRPLVMACDRYERAEENMRSLALALESLATLERHGGGVMLERAFAGFAAITGPAEQHWSEVLGVARNASSAAIEAAFRAKSNTAHPDKGGSHEAMALLTSARAQAHAERKD